MASLDIARIRLEATSLHIVIANAINEGDWIVDGACDPCTLVEYLGDVLTGGLTTPTQRVLEDVCIDLARGATAAIKAGDWRVRPNTDLSIIRELSMLTPAHLCANKLAA